jgi:hypothetical protein
VERSWVAYTPLLRRGKERGLRGWKSWVRQWIDETKREGKVLRRQGEKRKTEMASLLGFFVSLLLLVSEEDHGQSHPIIKKKKLI